MPNPFAANNPQEETRGENVIGVVRQTIVRRTDPGGNSEDLFNEVHESRISPEGDNTYIVSSKLWRYVLWVFTTYT